MTIREIKNQYHKEIKNLYTDSEIDTIFFILAEKFLRKDKNIIRLGLDEEWSNTKSAQKHFEFAMNQLKLGTPYQYVVGETVFLNNRIFVNSSVLIPRPETEELAVWIMEENDNPNNPFNGNILDIGTGSGVLAIALKNKFPNAGVHALDISKNALEVASNNALYNNTEINFHHIDIFKNDLSELPYFDIIVSNPPYIPNCEKEKMNQSVTKFEPNEALFVPDDDVLKFYFQISQIAQDRLRPRGRVYLEFHQDYMEQTKRVYESGFAYVKVKKDMSNNWRMLSAEQPYTCG